MKTVTTTNEAIVTGVGGNIVSIEVPDGVIMKNEVANICVGDERLKSEVLRVDGTANPVGIVRLSGSIGLIRAAMTAPTVDAGRPPA